MFLLCGLFEYCCEVCDCFVCLCDDVVVMYGMVFDDVCGV